MPDSLQMLSNQNRYFLKDQTHIYYLNKSNKPAKVPGADYASFEVVSHCLAKDAHAVYALSGSGEGLQIFAAADMDNLFFLPATISGDYFADLQNLYHYNGHFIEYCNVIDMTQETEPIKRYLAQNHGDKAAWWNCAEGFYRRLQPLSAHHYQSENRIFYYFKDDKDVYDYPVYNTKVSGFNFDHDGCFIALRDVDVATFQVLNEIYAKDKNSVYFYARKIAADAATFAVIDRLFAKDGHGIWFNGRLADVADVDTFEVLTKNERRCEAHRARDNRAEYVSKNARIRRQGYAHILKKVKAGSK